jgi:hypothetical protein
MKNLLKNKQQEGKVAKAIESVTSRFPSDIFLWSAMGAMAASAILQVTDNKHIGLFFGQWVAPLLLFGVYNKLVKQAGHDIKRKEVEEPEDLMEENVPSYM